MNKLKWFELMGLSMFFIIYTICAFVGFLEILNWVIKD